MIGSLKTPSRCPKSDRHPLFLCSSKTHGRDMVYSSCYANTQKFMIRLHAALVFLFIRDGGFWWVQFLANHLLFDFLYRAGKSSNWMS